MFGVASRRAPHRSSLRPPSWLAGTGTLARPLGLFGILCAVSASALAACGGPDADADTAPADVADVAGPGDTTDTAAEVDTTPKPVIGLRALDRHSHLGSVRQQGHLNEIVVLGKYVYVTNSTDLVMTYRLTGDGGFDPVHDAAHEDPSWSCQTITAHPPSGTLYCRGAEQALRDVLVMDASNPRRPVPRPLLDEQNSYSVRDLEVVGDSLFAAALRDGLLRAPIAADGTPGVFERVAPELSMVDKLATDAGRLAVWDRQVGVVVLDGTLEEVARVAVPGPPTDLAFASDRIVAGLGSAGAVVFELADGALEPVTEVAPPCVVSAVDLEGQLLAVGCLSGLFAYDLEPDPPRLVGFEPSLGALVDVVVHEGEIVASDWRWMHRYAVDLAGEVVALDRPRGRHIPLGDDAELAVRNVGGITLHARVLAQVKGEFSPLVELAVQPGTTEAFTVTAEQLAAGADGWGVTELRLETEEGEGGLEAYDHLLKMFVVTSEGGAHSSPARGAPFPPIELSDLDDGLAVLPTAGAQRLVFVDLTCGAMWDELLDLSWQVQHGADTTPPLIIAKDPPDYAKTFQASWGLEALPIFSVGGSHAGFADAGDHVGHDIYEEHFLVRDIPGGASHPTDFVLDDNANVIRVERVYRGRWPL